MKATKAPILVCKPQNWMHLALYRVSGIFMQVALILRIWDRLVQNARKVGNNFYDNI